MLLTTLIAVAGMMLGMWLLSLPLRNVSIVDIGWGLGFVLVSWVCVAVRLRTNRELSPEVFLLPILTTLWGFRLSGYLAWRNIGKGEDYRYREMRERFGPSFVWSSLFIVFGLQGAVMWGVSIPLQAVHLWPSPHAPIWWLAGLGGASWLIGFFFESLGDLQLARFKSRAENKGRVMDRGLWRFTRHPNYFGDFMIWWGHWLVSMSMSDLATWWTVVSPILMSFLLIRVSGVALLEKSMKRRSPEYVAYIERTSPFFPRPPRGDSK